eukprot:scaffold6581_cov57-Attheya_sp.AAC.17
MSSPSPAKEEAKASAAAGAAATSSTENDATIAMAFQAVEKLTTLFGFDPILAETAVNEVGPDVTTAYNWILDQGVDDKGGPVIPLLSCPHVDAHCRVNVETIDLGLECTHYQDGGNRRDEGTPNRGGKSVIDDHTGSCPSGENWVCLECNAIRCSRYVNGHAVSHWEDTKADAVDARQEELDRSGDSLNDGDDTAPDNPDTAGHCIAVSLADLSVWCYECGAYLKSPKLEQIVKRLEVLKFGPDADAADKDIVNVDDDEAAKDEITSRNIVSETTSRSNDNNSYGHDAEIGATSIGEGDYDSDSSSDSENIAIEDLGVRHPHMPSNLLEMAKFISSPACRSIVILAGAGMSTAACIPDFRSSGGMYETLDPDLLTASDVEREAMRVDPTTVFERNMFLQNSLPCLELKRSFILGTRDQKWRATLAHRFVELLHTKTGKLTRLFTQNIDGLEGQCTDLPREKVVAVHGSMDQASCEMCGEIGDFDEFCKEVEEKIKDISKTDDSAPEISTPILCKMCGCATVKPSIVLFRSNLPREFYDRAREDLPTADLLIVVGTSLTVSPANTLVYRAPSTTLRLVVNNEPVGSRLGIQYGPESSRDFFAQGFCDNVFLELMDHLGWLKDIAHDKLPEASASLLRERIARASAEKNNVSGS